MIISTSILPIRVPLVTVFCFIRSITFSGKIGTQLHVRNSETTNGVVSRKDIELAPTEILFIDGAVSDRLHIQI